MLLQTESKSKLITASSEDGSIPNPKELIGDLNEVFATGEPGEISFVRGLLRCLGHSAANTIADIPEDLSIEIPPVNPWKLTKSLAKASISKTHRRELIARIGEDMSINDGVALIGVVSLYGYGKNAGLSKKEARMQTWDWYGGTGNSAEK